MSLGYTFIVEYKTQPQKRRNKDEVNMELSYLLKEEKGWLRGRDTTKERGRHQTTTTLLLFVFLSCLARNPTKKSLNIAFR